MFVQMIQIIIVIGMPQPNLVDALALVNASLIHALVMIMLAQLEMENAHGESIQLELLDVTAEIFHQLANKNIWTLENALEFVQKIQLDFALISIAMESKNALALDQLIWIVKQNTN